MRTLSEIIRGIIFSFFGVIVSHAMVADGVHHRQDYIKYAQSHDHFTAVCYVFNHTHNALQTGVLIAPDLVLTAAHGVMDNEPNSQKIDVVFGNRVSDLSNHTYRVIAVHIHSEYRHGHDHHSPKVDMALLRLNRPVDRVKPIPLADRLQLLPEDTFTVGTFGGMDVWDTRHYDKRAFALPEWDCISLNGADKDSLLSEKRIILGSIFFRPCTDTQCTSTQLDPESKQRGERANRNWHHIGRPPYALAMPGTSGAPVFIKRGNHMFVIGLVSSFSHMSDTSFKYTHGRAESERLIRKNVEKVYNRYQTLFVLPYLAHLDPIKPTDVGRHPIHLTIDPEIRHLVEKGKSLK